MERRSMDREGRCTLGREIRGPLRFEMITLYSLREMKVPSVEFKHA